MPGGGARRSGGGGSAGSRYIGCSNWTGSQIVEAQWAASQIGGTPFISLQPRYSLNARRIEDDILPACQRQGLGTMIYSPLGGGVLTGKYKPGEPAPEGSPAARGGFWTRRRLCWRPTFCRGLSWR